MPDSPDSEALLSLVRKIAGEAGHGEQVEAYVRRSVSFESRVCNGEVEQLSSATTEGVGVRVVSGGRQGMAWAGSFDPDIVDEVLTNARDNASFTAPDEHAGLAVPDGREPLEFDLWRDDIATTPTDDKIALAADIDGVAGDLEWGYPGTCGKDGQGVPVGMGTPSLRLSGLTIGGTAR